MTNRMLLIVHTALHRYAVARNDLLAIKLVARPSDLEGTDEYGHPYVGVELGSLLDPLDQSFLMRRHALLVPIRRKCVALLVDLVETFLDQVSYTPLPPLLRERLAHPWAIGALVLDTEIIVEIDIRAVARSALMMRG